MNFRNQRYDDSQWVPNETEEELSMNGASMDASTRLDVPVVSAPKARRRTHSEFSAADEGSAYPLITDSEQVSRQTDGLDSSSSGAGSSDAPARRRRRSSSVQETAAPAVDSVDLFSAGDSEASPYDQPMRSQADYLQSAVRNTPGVNGEQQNNRRVQYEAPSAYGSQYDFGQNQGRYVGQENSPQPNRYSYGVNGNADPRLASRTVDRPRYSFEDEVEEPEKKKGSIWVPILVILVLLAGIAAAVCIPDWNSLSEDNGVIGKVASVVAPVQEKALGLVNKIKGRIAPSDVSVNSFRIENADEVVPANVQFSVQTGKGAGRIRIDDDHGSTVYSGTYTGNEDGSADVIGNSDCLIWSPSVTLSEAYSGSFTVYVLDEEGQELAALTSEDRLSVSEPEPEVPVMSDFVCAPEVCAVTPMEVEYTIYTSQKVQAVRIIDEMGIVRVSVWRNGQMDGENVVEDVEDGTRWILKDLFDTNYTGTLEAQAYVNEAFTSTGFTVSVQLGSDPVEDESLPEEEELLPDEEEGMDGDDVTESYPEAGDDFPEENDPSEEEPSEEFEGEEGTEEELSGEDAEYVEEVADGEGSEESLSADESSQEEPQPEMAETASQEDASPKATPLPALTASASSDTDPQKLGLKETLYKDGKAIKEYSRAKLLSLLSPYSLSYGGANYAAWEASGVLTFRGGPLRQNSAYGTAEVNEEKLELVWAKPIDGMKTSDSNVYGITAPGQALIVKWPKSFRTDYLGIKSEFKDVVGLREVIAAGQDGYVHFYDLTTGEETRDPINLGAPSRGGLSLDTSGVPVLGVGQFNSRLANKTVKNGYHLINLVTNTKETLLAGDGKDKNNNYTGFTGAALFDKSTGTMIVASLNGVLYFSEIGNAYDAFDYASEKHSLKLSSSYQGYKAMTQDQKTSDTVIECSVAAYNNYVYYGDESGLLICVDANTLSAVWAVNLGQDIDSTPALDMEDDSTVALYTANLMGGKNAKCMVTKLDALTGKTIWTASVEGLSFNSKVETGIAASPVVGEKSISGLVIYTATDEKSSRVFALDKATGAQVWSYGMSSSSLSSPMAIYDEAGNAWIVQAEENGKIHLIRGLTGEVTDTIQLESVNEGTAIALKASPAAYNDLIIIGSTGKRAGGIFCLKIK